ncbi:hypothetical protein [Oscillibacter sp. GMB15532]|uniref:hypothetical protein n=1 Tax=Oscillibacter sp. GMB15532 TaxID=3230022 RepID=UPI0034DE69D2
MKTPLSDVQKTGCPSGAIPGLRTLKNLLTTALAPMGGALYVYGGGWNREDTGAGPQAVHIGLAPEWCAFFRAQNKCYFYRDYYPVLGENVYYYAGLDCSGYLGWTVYNTLHDRDSLPGYVCSSAAMAGDFARRGWGGLTEIGEENSLRPGDICGIKGHVWLCMGTCGDGSVLLAHSTPSDSRAGCPGGGVQLSALSPGDTGCCEALALAEMVMRRCPAWYTRYAPVRKPWEVYTAFSGGVFRWALDGGVITDPEGVATLSAGEVLSQIFRGTGLSCSRR